MMAIIKARYTRNQDAAKATIKYITHRPNREGKVQYRQLFTAYGSVGKQTVYATIDQAAEHDYFYHLIVSPDPHKEDEQHDLHLRLLAEETLLTLSQQTGQSVSWAGVVHADHTSHRHIHVLAILPTRLDRKALLTLREQATQEARMQRLELDQHRTQLADQAQQQDEQWDYSLLSL